MKCVILLLLLGACYAAQRGTIRSSFPEAYHLIPDEHTRSVHEGGNVRIVLGIKQRNVDKLESIFWSVNDPSNLAYGKFLDLDEIIELVAPTKESVNSVVNWLVESGIDAKHIQLNGANDMLKVYTSVAQAESTFQAPMTMYASKKTGRVVASMDQGYVVPDSINHLVDFVSGFNAVKDVARYTREYEAEAVSAKLSPRANSNAPLVTALYTSNAGFILNGLFVYCLDGSDPHVGSSVSCSDGRSLDSINAAIYSNLTGQMIRQIAIAVSCVVCSTNSYCKQTQIPFTSTSVFCGSYTVTSGVQNYSPYTVAISVSWSDIETTPAISFVLESQEDASPNVIYRQYGIAQGTKVTQSKNLQAVVEFSEGFLMSDAQLYFQQFNLPDMTNLITVVNAEYVDTSDPGQGEGILDIDCIMSTAQNCPTYYWGNENGGGDIFLTWITDVLNSKTTPYVHSVSWGGPEIYPLYDPEFNTRSNIEFLKAGTRGLTIVVSSGDSGVQASVDTSGPAYYPDYPASSPYVTAVGATVFAASSHDPSCYNSAGAYICTVGEQAASTQNGAIITSGGGFSNLFTRPSYQDAAVTPYLSSITQAQKNAGVNITGRGYPDVSVIGHNIPVVYNGESALFDGTSASAPFFAAMVTLWNDIRLSQSKSPMGFINPFLYSLNSSNFNDIVEGSNFCTGQGGCSPNGFAASAGWDPVTGLGTPRFAQISSIVSGLPDSTTAATSATTSSSSASTTSANVVVVAAAAAAAVVVAAVLFD